MQSTAKPIKGILRKSYAFVKQGAEESETCMIPFGIFGLVAYLFYYLINLYLLASVSYDSLSMRIGISIVCLFLTLKNYWPKKLRPLLPLYWYVTLLYAMPFFITFMTLENHGASAWVMNLLAIVILMMLLVDWISYTILLLTGVLLAWLTYYLTATTAFVYTPGIVAPEDIISTFSISIIMGIIFSRNKDIALLKYRIESAMIFATSIAHELRTPLAAINAGTSGLKEYLPDLIATYDLAKKHNLPIPNIRPSQFSTLNSVLDAVKTETEFAHTIINMLLINVDQSDITFSKFEVCSMANCNDEALQRYPFPPGDRNIVHWVKKEDFLFAGRKLLVIHIVFNLLKNSIYYIKAARKGEIKIWLIREAKYNKLYFRDTGKGIPANILPRIFDRFFTRTYHGSGVGLAFCKMVMRAYGGDITCNSREGEYTEFILNFPIDATLKEISPVNILPDGL